MVTVAMILTNGDFMTSFFGPGSIVCSRTSEVLGSLALPRFVRSVSPPRWFSLSLLNIPPDLRSGVSPAIIVFRPFKVSPVSMSVGSLF